MNTTKTLYLIDGHAMLYRAYYAFMKRPITTSSGVDTSAIYGFTRILMDLLRRVKPSHIIVAFDPGGKNFRHDRYPLYKANRQQTPDVIKASLPVVKQIAEAFNIPVVVTPGYEADDVIGTIANYISVVYTTLNIFGISARSWLQSIYSSWISTIIISVPTVFFIIAFAVIIARKYHK
jgi:5'-3' exonuclease